MPTQPRMPGPVEYVVLVALITSIVALGTDIMLPALGMIGTDLGLADLNDAQLVVSAFFLGIALGQIFAGPLSDRFGRKPVIYAGFALFALGCLLSMTTESWTAMILGRILQGVGASGPRIVSIALVRDSFEGRPMARIMSFISAAFILVPIVAPAIGQGLIALSGWRSTFAFMILIAVASTIWLHMRMPETHPLDRRKPFSATQIFSGLAIVLRTPAALGYTLATGLIFGAFLGYLSSAQQVFQVTFGVGTLFPLYFAVAALSIGAAALLNARLVMRLGMRRLTTRALTVLVALSLACLARLVAGDHEIPLWVFMIWQLSAFFCIGILFGNLTALAMEPLGAIAGLGAAFVGALSTLMSLPLGWSVGHAFDGTATPLVAGFALLGLLSLITCILTDRAAPAPPA